MNNWQYGQGGPMQQAAYNQNLNGDQYVRLPDGNIGTIGDLVKYYSGGQQQQQFHPADLQEMQRQQSMGVQR